MIFKCVRSSKLKYFLAATVFAASLSMAQTASAGGFYIQEQSASGLGAAFAGVSATPRDSSTLFYNIAGMTHLSGTNANLGAHLIFGDSEMRDTGSTFGGPLTGGNNGGNPFDPAVVPNLYITHQTTDNFWIGLGITAPFGLELEYNDDFFARYDSLENELMTIDIQPSMAYRFNDWLSVGAGINYQFVNAKLTSVVSDGAEGISELEGDDASFGYTASVLLEPWEHTRLGVNYRSTVNHTLDGRISLTGTAGSDFNVAGSARLSTPDIANFAVSHDISEQWTLLGQANWYGWNDFEAITARNAAGGIIENVVQNYQAVWGYAIGAEYTYDDEWTFRAGYQYDNTPTTDEYRTTRIPDGDRQWFTAGTTYNMNNGFSFDLGLAYIDVDEETINISRTSNLAAINAATEGSVAIVSLGLNYKF